MTLEQKEAMNERAKETKEKRKVPNQEIVEENPAKPKQKTETSRDLLRQRTMPPKRAENPIMKQLIVEITDATSMGKTRTESYDVIENDPKHVIASAFLKKARKIDLRTEKVLQGRTDARLPQNENALEAHRRPESIKKPEAKVT